MSAAMSRRQMLCSTAAGSSLALTTISLASVAEAATPQGISPELARLIADYDQAAGHLDTFYETVFRPASDRADAMRAAIPHVTIPAGSHWRGDPAFWSTNHRDGLPMAQRLVSLEPRTSKRSDVQRARKLVAAMHRRRRAADRAERVSGLEAAVEREEALGRVAGDRQEAVFTFAARSLADLDAKLAFITHSGGMDDDELMELVRSDVTSLMAMEAGR